MRTKLTMIVMAAALAVLVIFYVEKYGYYVPANDAAVVFRDGVPVRVDEWGRHYLRPFGEHYEIFPTGELFLIENRTVAMPDKASAYNYRLSWRVCDAMALSKLVSEFDREVIEGRLIDEDAASAIGRGAWVSVNNGLRSGFVLNEISSREFYGLMRSRGICALGFMFFAAP